MVIDVEKWGTFTLDERFLDEYRNRPVQWGFGDMSWVTYKRTYSRDGEDWWQTCRRVIEGMFTVQRVHCLERGLPWDEDKAHRFACKAYDRLFHFKWTPPGRGLWMMGTDYIYSRGGAALNNCFAAETEIITAEGTKSLAECAGTTQTLLTRNGKWIEAPIRSFGDQALMKVTLTRQGKKKVVFATADHRWFTKERRNRHRDQPWREVTTAELNPETDYLPYVFGQGIKNLEPSSFGIAHGMTYGDGSSTPGDKNANYLMLCGSKDRQLARFFEMCPKSERPDACEGGALRIGGLPNFFRERPHLSETKSYLYGWLAGYFAADGTVTANGQTRLCSAERADLEFVRDVCYVLGIGTYAICEEESVSNLTEESHKMFSLTLMRDTLCEDFFLIDQHRAHFRDNPVSQRCYWNVEAVEDTDRVEEVYCATVEKEHAFALADNILTGNCGFISTKEIDRDFARPFAWMFGMSMLGVGVGFDTKGAGKLEIVEPTRSDETFVVPDSREGWAEALTKLLEAYVGQDSLPADWDFSKIRKKGAEIKSFGGVASGPDPLEKMLATLENLYDTYVGQEIDSKLIVDTMNITGRCVVSGGVRRTAQIAFGEPDDTEFLDLKMDPEKVSAWRWASNNSIAADVGMDYEQVAERTGQNGEPGYLWLENARAFGRMKDDANWKDERAEGSNPCVTADTVVMTGQGPRRVEQLIDTPFDAFVDGQAHTSADGFWKTGVKPVFILKTKEGHSVKVTDNHQILTAPTVTREKRYEMWVEAQDLNPGDQIVLNNVRELDDWDGPGSFEEGWLVGNLLGDGHLHDGQQTCNLQFWGPHKEQMLDVAMGRLVDLGGPEQYHEQRTGCEVADRDMVSIKSRRLLEVAREYGVDADKNLTNDTALLASRDFQAGFLRGIFDADGSVQGTQQKGVSIRLTGVKRQHLAVAQKMLMNLGINSTLYNRRRNAGSTELPDGHGGTAQYDTHAIHEIVISNDNLFAFQQEVGFDEPAKSETLAERLDAYKRSPNRERFVATFESLVYAGIEPVYDCTVDDIHRFAADGITVHNCVEQTLWDKELCCLVETYPTHHDDFEDYKETLRVAYQYAKTVTLIQTHDAGTNAVMLKNRRIGCSMTGIVQAINKHGYREFFDWCDEGYDYIQYLDKKYSDWLCIPRSIKTTSVKPSGTVSLLAGSTPGVHWDHAPYYLRRVRVQEGHELLDICREAGYDVEKDHYSDNTMVISFPIKVDSLERRKNQVSLREKIDLAAQVQHYWADNQVSCTAEFDPDTEADEIPRILAAYETRLKGISFLPMRDHGYKQPPYETISEQTYHDLMDDIAPLKQGAADDLVHDQDDKFCSGEACKVEP